MLKKRNYLFDHLFWIFLFLYTDPGGYQAGYFNQNLIGPVNFGDFFFLILLIIYSLSPKSYATTNSAINKNLDYAIGFWFAYFLVMFGYIMNETSDPLFFLVKMRRAFYAIGFFIFVRHFVFRNPYLFIKYLIIFSSIVFLLFFSSILTGYDFIPIKRVARGFIESTRYVLHSYSLMGWMIPISLALLIFKIKVVERKTLLVSGGLMILMLMLALTRRHFIFTFLYAIIMLYLAHRINKIRRLRVGRFLPVIIIPIMLAWLFFPSYINATKSTILESWSVISEGKTTVGEEDQRLSILDRTFIVEKITKNILFGNGFNYLWFTGQGDDLGFEGSDYPFISALAQFGIIGLMFFLPVYILLYRYLFLSIKKIRIYGIDNMFISRYELLLYLLVVSTFLLQLVNYTSYFSPAGLAITSFEFYVELGILAGIINRINLREYATEGYSVNPIV